MRRNPRRPAPARRRGLRHPPGRELVYQHITDTEPMGESQDAVEKTWIDSEGNHWYHIHWVGWGYDDPEQKWEGFSLLKVNAAGTVQEGMWNRFGYPEELDPLSPNYGIMYRQKAIAAPAPVLKADDPLLGTWVNEEYGGVSNMRSQKLVIFAEGRELDYRNIPDTEPEFEGRFTLERTWVDEEGSHWYKMRYRANYYPYRETESWGGYALTRVNAEGAVLEGVNAGAGYPEQMSVIGGDYGVYYRQE